MFRLICTFNFIHQNSSCHFANQINISFLFVGTKFVRGMTENSNDKLHLPQFCPQISRHLTSPVYSDVCRNLTANNQLTDSNLQYNVQIVLNNLRRNASRAYLNEKLNNNCSSTTMSSPESDLNSNPQIGQQLLGCSIASSHDFTHDNSDYQWFQDYG